MRKYHQHLVGPTMYLVSVAAAIFTVETLRLGGSANLFLEWVAIVLIISALSDLGMPNTLQWALISQRNMPTSQKTYSLNYMGYLAWIKWFLRGFKSPYIFFGLLFAAIATISQFNFNGLDQTIEYVAWQTAAVAIVSVNIRKFACAFLDGAGLFAISRLIHTIPNILMALIVGFSNFTKNSPLAFLDIAVIAAISYFSAGAIGLILLFVPTIHRQVPPLCVSEKEHTSSLRWYLLSISSTAQSQFFFVLAPYFGSNEIMVPVFYAQKAVQVSTEFIAQFLKEWTDAAKKSSEKWKSNSQRLSVRLGILPAMAGGLALLYSSPMVNVGLVGIATLATIEAGLSAIYTCRGHIALMSGRSAPVGSFMIGSALQTFLTLILVPVIGAAGFYSSALISGVLFSYRANQEIFKEVTR